MKSKTTFPPSSRTGFTLLELIVAISIIAILMSLILPAISGSMRRANEVAVATEMKQLEQALAAFKSRYNTYPPSSITLWGTAAGWNAHPQHKSMIRDIWRDFDFGTGGRGSGHPWGTADKVLSGDECLVFFLGGVPSVNAGAPPTLTGFSTNGRFPFVLAGDSRVGPFFTEWKEADSRLVDGWDDVVDPVADGIYSYCDGLGSNTVPMWYSAAKNKRYDTTNGLFYVQGDGRTPWNAETFQIVAPGADDNFGDAFLAAPRKAVWSESTELGADRLSERDNITNFSGGRLQK